MRMFLKQHGMFGFRSVAVSKCFPPSESLVKLMGGDFDKFIRKSEADIIYEVNVQLHNKSRHLTAPLLHAYYIPTLSLLCFVYLGSALP